ncbi:MAG: mannitol dehydrogenase family protein [Pseudomonadota bacterium]
MPRIVHIGVGNFHRAHQAWYTARVGGDWSITGVVMGNAALYEALRAAPDYALGLRSPDGLRVQRIGVHDRYILARQDPTTVIDALADPDVAIVTLTITEAGYGLASDGTLDLTHPAIAADLAGQPTSAIGLLAHGLARRVAARAPAVTVMSCDNLRDNGRTLGAALASFAAAADLTLDPRNRFPNAMVDRITPATDAGVANEIARATGRPETAPVLTEAFSDWVIEDAFAGPRPAWEAAGAEIVGDVGPFETRKLRLLNAAHSYLAYAGQLAGHTFVHEAIADPALRAGVEGLWDEAEGTLAPEVRAGAAAYRAALLSRFAVVEMRHTLSQIARDGSLKLRERIAPVIAHRAEAPWATEALAAWITVVQRAERGGPAIEDRLRAEIAAALRGGAPIPALAALAGIERTDTAWLDDLAARVRQLSS